MEDQKPLRLAPNSANMALLKAYLGPPKHHNSTDRWIETVILHSLPALIQISEHDGQPLMPRLPPSSIVSESPSLAGWRLAMYHRIRTRSLASLVPHGNKFLRNKMADLDKLLELKLSLLIAMDFEPKGIRERDQAVDGSGEILLNMLLEPVDPELDSQQDIEVCAGSVPKRHRSRHGSQEIGRPASLETLLDQSIRLNFLTCSNFAEHYHMAHMCLVVALSRKLAILHGTGGGDCCILNDICKGWNFNLGTRKMDPVGDCEIPMEAWDAMPGDSTCIREVQSPCSDYPTLDRISEVEDELIRRIAELEAENLAALEETYECICNLYDEY